MPKAGAQCSRLAAPLKTLSQAPPVLPVRCSQFRCRRSLHACRGGGDQPDRAAQDRTGRGRLAPRRAPLVIALRAEQMFEIVVGPRQAGHRIGVEQPRAVAARHLLEMIESLGQRSGPASVPLHRSEHPINPPPHQGGALVLRVAEPMGYGVNEPVGLLHVRPQGSRALQSAPDQLVQARERRREAPFCCTRSRLPATFSSRCFSLRPDAARGARPSSVMALRTAAQ